MIVKPDVITPGSVMELVDICNEAGLPAGVVNLLSGDPPFISDQLLSSDIIKKVSITGSTRVGKIILKKAAEKVQRVTMELSGHSPFIVFDDVDLDKVTDMAIFAKFRNNGQVCISPSRFYIHESKKNDFTNLIVEKTKKLKIGNGIDKNISLGPMTTKQRLDGIEKLVDITKKEGAKIIAIGRDKKRLEDLSDAIEKTLGSVTLVCLDLAKQGTIEELSKKIICRMCRAHFNTYIQKHNYKQFIKSKSLLREYFINLHNSVNLKKKKKIVTIQKVIRFYQNPDIKSKVIDKTGLDVCKYFDQFKIKEFVKLMNRTFYDVFIKKKKILDEKKQTEKPNVINRKQEQWKCYLNKYPDLKANYLKGKKPHNRKQAIHHWENHGRNEGRLWGC